MMIYWRTYGVRSIICDTNPDQLWPPCALVFRDPEKFWPFVWTQKGCAVFADEGGETVNRNRDLSAYFTRGRQAKHIIHICGHHYSDLLPKQRDQLGTLFLFLQAPSSAESWADEWSEPRLRGAVDLAQYQFLWVEKFGDPVTRRHAVQLGTFPLYREVK